MKTTGSACVNYIPDPLASTTLRMATMLPETRDRICAASIGGLRVPLGQIECTVGCS
jgi:hypothetical protein